MHSHPPFVLGAVILAAGRSSRMGTPKLLLPWLGTTVIGHLVQTWQQLGATQIAVVHATADHGLLPELDRLRFPPESRIANSKPDEGMFSSIQCATNWEGWRPEVTHRGIILGDQPHLLMTELSRFLAFCRNEAGFICQPSRNGRSRHPVILPKSAWQSLQRCETGTLKDFLQINAGNIKTFESADPGLELDLDQPEDYRKALGLLTGPDLV